MTKKSGTCTAHGDSFARVHGRVDAIEIDMTKVNITLFGDPSKNVEGFLQMNARFQERIGMWMKIWTFLGSALAVSLIGVMVKLFMGGK